MNKTIQLILYMGLVSLINQLKQKLLNFIALILETCKIFAILFYGTLIGFEYGSL